MYKSKLWYHSVAPPFYRIRVSYKRGQTERGPNHIHALGGVGEVTVQLVREDDAQARHMYKAVAVREEALKVNESFNS